MTRVLMWKELREQWATAVVLVALGVAVLFGVALLSSPPFAGSAETGAVFATIAAWVCGLIGGAQALAGEREAGTVTWLDSLPATRRQVWTGKALFVLAAAGVQSILLIAVAIGLGFTPGGRGTDLVLAMLAGALSGLAYGLFSSAVARTPMAAVGWALATQLVALCLLGLVLALAAHGNSLDRRGRAIADGSFLLFVVVPLVLSFRRFTRPDRQRRVAAESGAAGPGAWRVLLWLIWRQGRGVIVPALGVGLVVAVVLPVVEPRAWPFLGLVLGLIAGVGTFAPDQAGEAYRFLGDRRLPRGSVWLVKIGVRAAAVLVVIAVLVLIAACWQVELQFRLQVEANKPKPEEFRAVSDLLTLGHLALVPVYGFALAQFFGMVCRKGAVAVVLSALTGVGLLALWLPSVVIGGLSAWQWIGPPLILLATTRLAMRPWVAGRLWRGRPAAAWVGAVLLAAAGVAAGLWSRAAVVPDVGPPFDVVAFVAAAPTPEQNESGRKLRQARQQFITLRDQARAQHEPPFVPGQTDWASLSNQARDAINNGWPAKADELNAWMDQLFAGEWVTTLRQAVALPPGVVAQPRLPTEPDQEDVFRFLEMAVLLNARAVQLQARGEHEQAWDMLRLALATARHLRHRAGLTLYTVAENIEQTALRAVPRWAAAAAGRPDLLRRAVTALREDEAALPPFAEVLQTEYAAARERLDLPPPVHPNETPFGWQLRQLAQAAPWERDRTLRGLNLLYAGWLRNATLDYPTALKRANTVAIETGPISPLAYELLAPWVPADTGADAVRQRRLLARLVDSFPQAGIELPWFTGVFVWERYDRVLWRAAQLQVGLLLYEREHGRPAERLGALVLDILPAVPIDPFGNEPFHYRVSTGEPPPMSEREDDQGRVTAAPGQGVIWSVSTDGRDDGGKRYDTLEQLFGRGSRQPESDLIFLVPRPTKP